MIFLSFIESFCFSWRWSRRMSISSSLGITSLTGTGLARGAFWSRCQDFWRTAKGRHFSTNISYSSHLVPGTIGSVWLILTRMEPGFGTTLESRLTSSCKELISSLWTDFHLYYVQLIYSQISLSTTRANPKGGRMEPGLSLTSSASISTMMRTGGKSHQQRFCTCVWIKIQWKPKHFFINIGNLQGVGAAKLWREWWEIKFQLKNSKFFYC